LPRLLSLLENLTNWYIRFNRKRLKGQADIDAKDTICALNTLFEVLFTLVRALAPFMPFLTEHIYRLLAPHIPGSTTEKDQRSVHFLAFPDAREDLFDQVIERRVSRMQKVIELGRSARDKSNVGLKTPLRTLIVLASSEYVDDVRPLESYIQEELNIRELVLTSDEKAYNVRLRAIPVWAVIGQKFKKEAQILRKSLQNLTNEQVDAFIRDKSVTVDGFELDNEDLIVVKEIGNDHGSADEVIRWASTSDNEVIILLDPTLYPDLHNEGLGRDLISRVQQLRKRGGLSPTDDVRMEYAILQNPLNIDFRSIVAAQEEIIKSSVRGMVVESSPGVEQNKLIVEETQDLTGVTLSLRLLKI
jgi:isoleucyl-tRNA synthetase